MTKAYIFKNEQDTKHYITITNLGDITTLLGISTNAKEGELHEGLESYQVAVAPHKHVTVVIED